MLNTPDHVSFNGYKFYYYDKNAYPFIVANNEVFIGERGSIHSQMKPLILSKHFSLGLELFNQIVKSIFHSDYAQEGEKYNLYSDQGNYYYSLDPKTFKEIYSYVVFNSFNSLVKDIQLFGRIWYKVDNEAHNIISMWPGNRFKVENGEDNFFNSDFKDDASRVSLRESKNFNDYVTPQTIVLLRKVLAKTASASPENTYLCLGKTTVLLSDLINSKVSINFDSSESEAINKQMQQIHLLPAKEKMEILKPFRKTRDKKMANKLGKMCLAQYNALRYVDESKKGKIIRLKESQLKYIISESIKKGIRVFGCL